MKEKLENLLERMKRAKRTVEWALENCDKDERQNIIWIDCRLEFWINDLTAILVPPKQLEECWIHGVSCSTEDGFCPHNEVKECMDRNGMLVPDKVMDTLHQLEPHGFYDTLPRRR